MNPLMNLVGFISDTVRNTSNRLNPNPSNRSLEDFTNAEYFASVVFGAKSNMKNAQYARSIRGKADRFVLQYPLVSSNSITPDTIEMIRNQIELERASEIAMVLKNEPMQTFDPDGAFLGNLHTNVNLSEGTKLSTSMDEVSEDHSVLMEDRLETKSINEHTIPRNFLIHINENDEDYMNPDAVPGAKTYISQSDVPYESLPPARTTIPDISKQNRSVPITVTTDINYVIHPRELNARNNSNRGVVDSPPIVKQIELSFGIKAINHLVESKDVVFFLSDSTKHSSLITKLVKLTTGEMKFVRDILFRQDRAKRAATASRNKNNVWKNLTMLGDTEGSKNYFKHYNKLIKMNIVPTTTLMISTDEVDVITRDTGRDLLNDSNFSHKVYSDLYLLDLIVIDEPNSLVYKYNPRDKSFNRFTFNSLEGRRLTDSAKNKGMDEDELLNKMKKSLRSI